MGRWAGVRDGERGCEWGDGRGCEMGSGGANGEMGGGARWGAGVRMGSGGANGERGCEWGDGGVRKGRWAGPLPAEDACNMKKQKDGIASPSSKGFCFCRSYVYETGRPLSAQVTALEENFFF